MTAVFPVTAVVAVPPVPPVVAVVAVTVGVLAVRGLTVGILAVRDLTIGGLSSIAVLCLRVLACIVRGVLAVGPTVSVTRPAGLPLPSTVTVTVTVMAGSLVITFVPLLCAVFSLTVPASFARGRRRLALDGR